MSEHKCELCGTPVKIVGHTTKHYEPITPAASVPVNGDTSDGYHTFNELYDHRVLLWINICNLFPEKCYLVPEHFEGWFLLGMETSQGQISYHCPNKFYGLVHINIEKRHPEFDGHTSKDIIERLKTLPFHALLTGKGER